MQTQSLSALVIALAFGSTSLALAGDHDWPQWRGPDRTGASEESNWSAAGVTGPLWQKEIGLGHSCFATIDGRVYTLGHDVEAGEDVVFCLDADTGEEAWTHRYESDIWDQAHDGGTLTTPTIVGDVVYTSNREGKLFCFDSRSGEVKWSKDLRSELAAEPHTWGFSCSPLILGDMLIHNHGQVAAFDRHSGEVLWRTERHFGNAYSTPAAFDHHGRAMLAVLNGDGLAVLTQDGGEEVAFFEWAKRPSLFPMTPVIVGDGRIFISAGYDRGAAMLKLIEQDDGYALDVLWESRVMRNKMSGCVLWEDHLYGFDESILKCIDLDGNEKWRRRGLGTGSMTIAGGRMIIMSGRGDLVIADANPDAFVEEARIDLFDEGTYWTTPILSNGLVYARSSLGQAACVDFRSGAAPAGARANEESRALPAAEEIIAGHVEAIGGDAALDALTAAHFVGAGESLRNTVSKGPVEMHWRKGEGFAWVADSGFEYGYNRDAGWMLGTFEGPQTLRDEALSDVHEAGDLGRILRPAAWYRDLETKGVTTFDDRECYMVEAQTPARATRRLYFETESGLYAGHDGDGVHMWTVSDYVETAGVRLPMRWAFYEPVSGEMHSAQFERVVLNDSVDASMRAAIETPKIIALMNRSPEELAEATKSLRAQHADLLGRWSIADGPPIDDDAVIDAADGFLTLQWPGQEPGILSEPDENGSMMFISFPDVRLTVQRDDEGRVDSINVEIADDPFARLVRSENQEGETAHIWPQFRGPGARGLAAGPAPPISWNVETGENIKWKTAIPGLAHSSPVIWGDRLFITSAVKEGGDDPLVVGLYGSIDPVLDDSEFDMRVYCLDRDTGEIVWEKTAITAVPKVKRHPKGSHAASSPATDGEHVVAFFGSEGLYCYDVDGNLKWSRDFGVLDSGYFAMPDAQWGFASSPIIHEDKVIVQCDVQGESFVAALDLATGEELWRTPRDEVPTWSTPTVDVREGRAQVICNGWKEAAGYDVETGARLWHLEGGGDIPVPTPIVAHDLIYLTSAHGRERPIRAIRIAAEGDLAEDREGKVAWEHLNRGNYMQTPIIVGDILYMCADAGILAAYDAKTGGEYYRERIGTGRTGFTASIVATNDHLYITAEDGSIHVHATGETLQPITVNHMGEECMATPAIVDGVIYYRTRRHVIAIGE